MRQNSVHCLIRSSFMIDYEGSDPEKKFWIDPSSGVVSLVKPLDRETVENYELYIWAVDRGQSHRTLKVLRVVATVVVPLLTTLDFLYHIHDACQIFVQL